MSEAQREATWGRISRNTEPSDLADCALVIEAQKEPLLGGRERWVRCLG